MDMKENVMHAKDNGLHVKDNGVQSMSQNGIILGRNNKAVV